MAGERDLGIAKTRVSASGDFSAQMIVSHCHRSIKGGVFPGRQYPIQLRTMTPEPQTRHP